jgi:hypothetical protein
MSSGNLVEQKKNREQAVSVPAVFSDGSLNDMLAMAKYFMESKAVPSSLANEAQVFMVIKAGAEKGMQPVDSLQSFYIVNGRITMWGAAVPARLRQYGIFIKWVEKTDKKAVVTLIDKKEDIDHTEEFTWEDASKAGLTGKDIWKKYPKNMLAFKALGNAVRFFCPHVLNGMYIAEDVMDEDPNAPQKPQPSSANRYGVSEPYRPNRPDRARDVEDATEVAQEEPEEQPQPQPEAKEIKPTAPPPPVSSPPKEPEASKEVRIEKANEMRKGLEKIGITHEHWDDMLPVLCDGKKTVEALDLGIKRVDLVVQMFDHMNTMSLSEKDFITALTAGSCSTFLDMLKKTDKIEEWHEAVFS